MPDLKSVPIVFANNYAGPGVGGGEVQLLYLVGACVEAGMQVTVVAQKGASLVARARSLGATAEETDFSPRNAARAAAGVRHIARDARILQGTGWWTNVLTRLAARDTDLVLVSTVHVDPDASLLDGGTRAGLAARALAERATRGRVNAYVAVSDAIARALGERGIPAGQVVTIHNGVDVAALRAAAAAAPPAGMPAGPGALVGCIARLEPVKGVEHFVRAAALLAQSHPEARFLLAGAGSLESRLREIMVAAGLRDRMAFLGSVPAVEPLLAACDVVVMPSLSEGFGLVAIEAGVLGKPVVASAVGGLMEAVDNGVTGLLVPPGDASALAGAIGTLLHDSDRARKMGDAARDRVERLFTVERMAAGYLELYADLRGN